MPSDLPAELTDLIIASVSATDRQTLLSCALVCRAWLPASRHRLFAHLIIRDSKTCDLLVNRVLRSDDMKPYLATATRQLNLVNCDLWPLGHRPIPMPFFALCYGCFPRLETLVLYKAARLFDRPTAPLLLAQFTSLKHLEINSSLFPSFVSLRRTISALKDLETLTLKNVSVQHPMPSSPWSLPSRQAQAWGLKLRRFCATSHLDVSERAVICIEATLGWLSTTSAAGRLEKLQLHVSSLQQSTNSGLGE